jgi:hypothetical protein
LIVLAVSPFTAPFSTCDLSTMLTAARPAGLTFLDRSPSLENGGQQPSAASTLSEDQFKNVSLTATATTVAVFVDVALVSASVSRASVVRPPLLTLRL